MKKYPVVFPKYETGDYGAIDFDPEVDFAQFLNEARQHKNVSDVVGSSLNVEHGGRRRSGDEKKEGKKSWKSSLFSWLKSDKKSKHRVEPATITSSCKPKPRKGHTSGPIYGSTVRGSEVVHHRPTSGPLSGFFSKTKRSENKTPYLTLGQLDRPNGNGASPYGPVYLVT
ncbi:uncharacterized protein LOC116201190 [Punica granatum]|nr:uncharacterized protein LOC116201190 [Punica granatum]PKI37936.1 hypothetical protein CRG98_041673 [Punica granatum]